MLGKLDIHMQRNETRLISHYIQKSDKNGLETLIPEIMTLLKENNFSTLLENRSTIRRR